MIDFLLIVLSVVIGFFLYISLYVQSIVRTNNSVEMVAYLEQNIKIDLLVVTIIYMFFPLVAFGAICTLATKYVFFFITDLNEMVAKHSIIRRELLKIAKENNVNL
jgi:hypothetical protein